MRISLLREFPFKARVVGSSTPITYLGGFSKKMGKASVSLAGVKSHVLA